MFPVSTFHVPFFQFRLSFSSRNGALRQVMLWYVTFYDIEFHDITNV